MPVNIVSQIKKNEYSTFQNQVDKRSITKIRNKFKLVCTNLPLFFVVFNCIG